MKNSPVPLILILVVIAAIATVEGNDGAVTTFDYKSNDSYDNDYYYPSGDTRKEEPSVNAEVTQKQKSPYSRYVSLGGFRKSQYQSAPGDEKITISLSRSAPEPVNITGWQLWSVETGNRATIGKGAYTYHLNGSNLVPIILTPGTKADVFSGSSPLEYSFLPNICMGYIKDIRDFPRGFPSRCPSPGEKAFPLPFFDSKYECRDFIETLSYCEVPQYKEDFDPNLSQECRDYVREITGYENCVRIWQNDEDFYENKWWVFLGKPSRMYGERDEQILLFDERGILVDTY